MMAGENSEKFDIQRAMRGVLAAAMAVLVLAVFPYTPEPAGDIKLLLLPVFALVLAGLLAWKALRAESAPRAGLLLPLLAGFVVVNAIAGAISRHPGNGFPETGRLISYFVFFFAASRAYSEVGQLKRLFSVIAVAVGLASVYGFMQRLGVDFLSWSESTATKNLPATFGNANFAGHALVLTLVLTAYLAAERSRLAIGLLPLLAAHLLMTHHRAGLLGAISAAGLAALLVAARRMPARGRKWLFGGVAAAGLAAVGVAGLRGAPVDSSLLLRYNSYFSASKMIAARPVLGYGPGNYIIENAPFWTPAEQEHYARHNKLNDHPHCELLYAGVSGGIPGAALFLAIAAAAVLGSAALFWRARSATGRRLGLMFAAFFCAWFVDGMFGFNLKSPVSGALFAVAAGLLDRATSPGTAARPAWRRAALPAALVLIMAAFFAPAAKTFAAAMLVNGARADIGDNAYLDAEKKLDAAEQLNPPDWNISYLRAVNLFAGRRYGEARECLGRTLGKNPCCLPAMADLAKLYMNVCTKTGDLEQLDEAEAWANRALELCPSHPYALDVLGNAAFTRAVNAADPQRRLQLLEESRAYCTRAMAAGHPHMSGLHTRIGQARALSGDLAGAEESFQAAARFCPPDKALWSSYRQVAARTGDYEAYAGALKSAIAKMKHTPEKFEPWIADAAAKLDEIQAKLKQTSPERK